MDVAHEAQGGVADLLPQGGGHEGSRRHFNDFLVAALDGAVPFEQVDQVAVFVPQDLDFDVFRIFQVFFDVDFLAAERFQGFRFGQVVGRPEFRLGGNGAHAAAAAAVDGFDDQRITVFTAEGLYFFQGADGPSLPGIMGMPARLACSRALTLSPNMIR